MVPFLKRTYAHSRLGDFIACMHLERQHRGVVDCEVAASDQKGGLAHQCPQDWGRRGSGVPVTLKKLMNGL